ncbi:MAG: hypothetical protein SFX73_29495 [Kofleriaceae bacterium]|nr:hypothetical protein [Kofleriaceae bacterium]
MMVLDAGALVAIERGDPLTHALLKVELLARRPPVTHGGVLGQVWRGDGRRQARIARILPAIKVVPLDRALGQRAGELLGRARKTDVVDAAVVLLATDGDTIVTSDPGDLEALAKAAGVHVDLVRV